MAENIDRLLAERRILRPNDKLPFTIADEIIDPETDRVMIEKLAMRRPGQGRGVGEVILRRGINEYLLPQFVATHLPGARRASLWRHLLPARWHLSLQV